MSKNYLHELSGYFRNLTWNRVVSFWLTIIIVSFVSIFVRAENESHSIIPVTKEITPIDINQLSTTGKDYAELFLFANDGNASWYGKQFHNRKTASGERYDMFGYSAAHRKLPFGTILRVTNPENNKSILVRINDRGPFVRSKVIDLSYQAMKEISGSGRFFVEYEGFEYDEKLLENSHDKLFFCYSLDYPLACLPENSLQIIDSISDFSEAVQVYMDYCSYNTKDVIYLIVPANHQSIEDKLQEQYFIALLKVKPLEAKAEDSIFSN